MSAEEEFDCDFDISDEFLDYLPWLETPLDASRHEIRLLVLHEGFGTDPISCSLRVASLDDQPYYETLSYVWGDASRTVQITVAGRPFAATTNLHAFLSHLRLPNSDRVLWADAICINQQDDAEKQHQIALMQRVYQQPYDAHIWLGLFTRSWQDEIATDKYTPASRLTEEQWARGYNLSSHLISSYTDRGGSFNEDPVLYNVATWPPDKVLAATFNVIREIELGKASAQFPLFLRRRHAAGSNEPYSLNRSWPLVMDCIQWIRGRDYWTRVWTLQEAVLPLVDPTIHIGTYVVQLSRLTAGLKVLDDFHEGGRAGNLAQAFMTLWRGQNKVAISDVGNYREMYHLDKDQIPLSDVMDSCRSRNATVPRDHFWGFQGLMADWIHDYFKTREYSLDCGVIFAECSKLLIMASENLEILDDAVGMRRSTVPNLPTWAIDLNSRGGGEYSVGSRWSLYNACKGAPHPAGIASDSMYLVQGNSYTHNARLIGTVALCAPHVSDLSRAKQRSLHHNVNDWDDTYKAYCASLQLRHNADSFWRTTLMDRNVFRNWLHERTPLPRKRLEEVQDWWRNYCATGDTRDLAKDTAANDGRRGDYQYRAVKWNVDRHRFFCTENGEPGLGPQEVEPGDKVFVLRGCPALAVLRPIQREGQEAFLFVGLCFVDGWMYGEGVRARNLRWQDVVLY